MKLKTSHLFKTQRPLANKILCGAFILAVLGIVALRLQFHESSDTLEDSKVEDTSYREPEAPPPTVQEMMEEIFTAEELTRPESQKLLEILGSPEYQAFSETSPAGIGEFLDFFEAQGLPIKKEAVFARYEAKFAAAFPERTAAELEPEMRSELSQIFLDSDIQVGTRAGLAAFTQSLETFLSIDGSLTWMNSYFKGDTDAFSDWAVAVFQNPTVLETDRGAMPLEPDVGPLPAHQEVNADRLTEPPETDSMETELELPDDVSRERSVELDAGRVEPLPLELTDDAFPAELIEQPKIPTDADFETELRESFSQERIHRAMSTLTQYGPEDGLRRVKESDPEIAKQLQRLLRPPTGEEK